MIEKGGRRDIFLGTRECQGYVEPCEFGAGGKAPTTIFRNLVSDSCCTGITHADESPLPETDGKMTANFWYPVMKNGVIEFPRRKNAPFAIKRSVKCK